MPAFAAAFVLAWMFLGGAGKGEAAAYPLKMSANGRYLVDKNDVPFLIAGDSPQSLMVNITEADADMYFANRASHGFNAVWINLLCAEYTGGRSDASTWNGVLPWTTPGDLSTPNEAYFAHCDRILQLAADHGLLVILDPAETGSFLSVMWANGEMKCRDYGRFLGQRYQNFDNLIWMSGNDFQGWSDPANDLLVTAVALGIKETDARHIHTVELDFPLSGSLDDPNWEPIISLNASYTYFPTYAQVLKDYNRNNFLPVFMVEADYEFENGTNPERLRRQEYWTNLSGATGQLYGNGYIWPFLPDWKNHLDTPGAIQFAHVKALFEPRAWYDLVPDQMHTVVTSGYGHFSDGGSPHSSISENDYVTAARTPNGSLVMAYLPTSRTITVDMAQLAGTSAAQWFDPSNGTWVEIAGSPFPNSGTLDFAPPGNNGDGDGDWVLVIETDTRPFRRGDANADGFIDISDAIKILLYLFVGYPLPCQKSADFNDDGVLDLTDPIGILDGLFNQGPEPAQPFPACGSDLTSDTLSCRSFPPCN